jgi:hypothetical protein
MSPSTAVWVVGERLAIGVQDHLDIHLYDETGSLELIIRSSAPRRRADAALYSGGEPVSEFLPAHEAIRLSEDGQLWVQEYVPPYEQQVARWWVFDARGMLIARATVPSGFVPHHIDSRNVLGVRTDELGVSYVERYAITR